MKWTTAAVLATGMFGVECMAADCASVPGLTEIHSAAWGIDLASTRLQTRTHINALNVEHLELHWAYGLSSDQPRSYPLVTQDTIIIGDGGRGLVALDRDTGCVRWELPHKGQIASAIVAQSTDAGTTLFFTDRTAGVYAVDGASGKLKWRSAPGDNPIPMYSGTPLVHAATVFVPLSSVEIGLTANPFYGCCTTSGGMAAVDASTGATKWHLRTIPDAPVVTGRHYGFVEEYGPSGAPVWGAPTLDVKRGLLYFGTGQNYSHPTTKTSDAIFAVDVRDGSVRWIRQFTENDAYNIACEVTANHPNCPDPLGPDLDFGAPPILTRLAGGQDVLIAGQKSGDVHAMNPDTGAVLWTRRIGRGGALGGIHWGMAANEALGLVFVPISDIGVGRMTGPGESRAGVYALDMATGEIRWSHARTPRCPQRECDAGVSAAITATADLVFAAGLDGQIEALDSATGELLWTYDSLQAYESVNGVPARGGAIDAHGPLLADDLLVISSGYGSFQQQGGNALLVFKLAEGAAMGDAR